MLRLAFVAAVMLVLTAVAAPDARANPPVSCSPGLNWDGQKCQVIASSTGASAGQDQDTLLGSPNSGTKPRICAVAGKEVPCQDPQLGWWSDSRSCYVKLTAPPPPLSTPTWAGRTDGAIYDCALPRSGSFGGLQYMFWSATAPAGPDPRVLAQTAIASMNLRPISIGIVPEDRPGSVGLVGMPVWLWAANPSQQTWGPIARTASAGGVTVRATANVSRVRWQMGDGNVVICTGPGTVYEDRFGRSDSPTCGYTYRRQGTYTVRAESQWSVAWSGMGVSGTIPVTLTRATTITVGELQVITTG